MKHSALIALAGAICLLLWAAPANAQATQTFVSGVGSDSGQCTRAAPCQTFAGAFAKTAAGGEIACLDAGDFGAVTIGRSVTIDCEAASNSGVLVTGGAAITITGGIVTLRGLDINGFGGQGATGVNITGAAVVSVENSRISGFGAAGISLASGGTLVLANTRIHNNAAGLLTSGSLTLRDDIIAGNTGDGLTVRAGASVLVDQTVLAFNGGAGLNVNGAGAAALLANSTITGNATGVSASGGTLYSFKNNQIAGNTVDGTPIAQVPGNLTLVAAVLPTSRSVTVGTTATAFATIIDAGPSDALACTIAPSTSIPANFLFQTTNPATNALTGSANTPANIPNGQAQSFVIALTPTAALSPTDVAFTFGCGNASMPAAVSVGINTLNLSASATPVPDIIALAASGDPGYVDIPGATGTGVFAVATINLGADAAITAAANTGAATLPVTILVCQTNPQSGVCLAPPSPTVTTDIQPNATPTFGIFVAGSGAVADLPGSNRVFVRFSDGNGVLRGETSVAVRTH